VLSEPPCRDLARGTRPEHHHVELAHAAPRLDRAWGGVYSGAIMTTYWRDS
jgi:hypothetical protein